MKFLTDVLWTPSTEVLKKLKYDVPRPSPYCLYVEPRNIPYQFLEQVSYRRYEDVAIWYNIWIQETCPTNILKISMTALRMSFLGILKASLYGSITKAKKWPKDKNYRWMVYYQNGLHIAASWRYERKEYELGVLKVQ